MRLPRLGCFAAFVGAAAFARAASFEDRIEALFRPPLAEMIALSPDGHRVAYTARTRGELSIVMRSLEPAGAKRTVVVEPARDADAALAPERPPAPLRFLRWATPTRVVFAPAERVLPLPPVTDKQGRLVPNPDGPTIVSPILAMDADGKQRGVVIDAHHFQETPENARKTLADFLRSTKQLAAARNEPVGWRMPHLDILGFLPRDREQLILQTRGGYSMPTQHLVDIRTGTVREFGTGWPVPPPAPHVYDAFRLKVVGQRRDAARPTTAWHDEMLAKAQRELETKFPRRIVELLDWSEARARLLFRVTGGSDPGRIFVYQRPEDVVVEILPRVPWLNAAKLHDTRFFECAAPDGARLSGYVTWPRQPRSPLPPPLLVVFPSGFPGHAHPAFDPEAQVFADLGFIVARLNHRSVAGVRPQDVAGLRAAVDRAAIDDARAALEWLATRHPDRAFDRKRVATLGRGFGGYLAARALQLEPSQFRCGIAIDAPMDLRAWVQPPPTAAGAAPATSAAPVAVRDLPATVIDHVTSEWKKLSVVDQAETLTQPLLLLVEPGRSAATDASVTALRARLHELGRGSGHVALDPGFSARPESRAAVYRKIEEFFHAHLPDYAVKIGPLQEVK